MAKRTQRDVTSPALPTREDVLRFLADHPSKATKRDIARAFEVRGEGRVLLKALLRELEADGLIERHARKISKPGALPPVLVCEAVSRDSQGDIFAEPLQWEADAGPRPRLLVVTPRRRKGPSDTPLPGIGDRFLARVIDLPPGYESLARAAVRPMKLIERKPAEVLGVVRRTAFGHRLMPVSKRQQEVALDPDALAGAEDGDLVAVEVIRAPRTGQPTARVVERLGSLKSEKAVSMIAVHANGIPHVFSAKALAEAEAAADAVGLEGRDDWRDLPLVTIDPADAKDHDDAVHAMADPDPANPGGHVVTVAIADVAAYVRAGTALDAEALERGNSVYFPDRVIPMLPERISNHLCSLKEGVDRPALAVRMVFDANGVKRGQRFHRIVMRSAARLAYPEAQAAIDGRPGEKTAPILDTVLRPLWAAYGALVRSRSEREPLDLDLPERKVLLHADGTVDRIIVPERLEAHRLIEEFMIQANVAAAETLEARRSPLIYRVHDQPSLAKLDSLREFLATLDLKLAKQGNLTPGLFNRILARAGGTSSSHLVSEVVLRSQSQAEYSPVNIGHFGLNLRRYAHFTSPIRRYADLIVHRALIRALRLGEDGMTDAEIERLDRVAADISGTERRAMAAERETIDRLVAGWLADRIGARFMARIAGVTKAGLFVRLEESGADGFIPAATIGTDYYAYDEVRHALVGSRSGETYQLGDHVEVKLVEVAPVAGALRFEVLSDGRRGKPLPRSRLKRPTVRDRGPAQDRRRR